MQSLWESVPNMEDTTPPPKRRAVFQSPNWIHGSSVGTDGQVDDLDIVEGDGDDSADDEEPLSSQMSTLSIASQDEEAMLPKSPDIGVTPSTVNSLELYFANDKPLQQEELLFYTLLLSNYGEKAFKQNLNESKYVSLIDAIKLVYTFKCTPSSLKHYITRVKDRKVKDVGRIKRRLRWVYFRKQIDEALISIGPYVPQLFTNKGKDAEPSIIKGILSRICSCLNVNVESDIDEIVDSHLPHIFNTIILPDLKRNWSICQHGNSTIFYRFGPSIGYAELEVIYKDNTISLVVEGKQKPDEEKSIFNYLDLKTALVEMDESNLCTGAKSPHITDFEESTVLFKTRDKKDAAYVQLVQSRFREKVIRSSFCHTIMHSDTESVCKQCSEAARYIERRSLIAEPSKEKQGRFDQLSYDELLAKARSQQSELKLSKRKLAYLQEKVKDMVQVGSETDSDLRMIFKQLTQGILASDARVHNNDCEWDGCSNSCKSPEELHGHLCSHITTQHVAPIERNYECLWDGCNKSFKKVRLLKNHLRDHTGSTSDTFFKVLLADQAKALTSEARQMRWHPLVIKWCLRAYSKSHSVYEDMRQGGFLRLPTGRTLSDYKNFDIPTSGWHMSNINALKDRFKKLKLPDKAAVGGLFFDELKIKEGLVWNQSTWELIGYVDIDESENIKESKDRLATHILQFFYKSLFHNFEYPVAFFLTKGICKDTLNRIFWVGVSMLEIVEINIILACCDGASENRAFINYNRKSKDHCSCTNPFSNMPLFFLSDPPHLIKKLRNNLFKSGQKELDSRFTRLMTLNGQPVIWQHIVDVHNRDKLQYLQETPLRRAHMDIDSLSKMRVKLAVESIARQEVRTNMLQHAPLETMSTQKFLLMCEKFWNVFNSDVPLRSTQDDRISVVTQIEIFLQQWVQQLSHSFNSKSARRDHFMSWQTLEDLTLSLATLKALINYIKNDNFFTNKFGRDLYIIPKRISQDFVESFFSKQRQSCGGTQNMTAYTYGYNIYSSLSQDATRLVRYKQTNVAEVEECNQAVNEKKTLPKRRSNGVATNDIVWPLDL